MTSSRNIVSASSRFETVARRKAHGQTFTPAILADFVAQQIAQEAAPLLERPVRILDPAVGHGELLICLLRRLSEIDIRVAEVRGFETDQSALSLAVRRLRAQFCDVPLHIEPKSFLSFVMDRLLRPCDLLGSTEPSHFNVIIANPPYVRTQVLGANRTQHLARLFGLSGRIDLYYAFVIGLSLLLPPRGVAGIIVSNRFMTTRSGESVRKAIAERLNVIHIWDLGDTKLFDAAVLPAVLLVRGGPPTGQPARFTSIYQTRRVATSSAANPIEALMDDGVVALRDGRKFETRHGQLNADGQTGTVWRISTSSIDNWLATVTRCQWRTFGDIGRVRVGVKTCADSVFIRDDWNSMGISPPELLRPVTTHHVGARYWPLKTTPPRQILYPHEVAQGRRCAVDLRLYPLSRAYLEQHRQVLERRRYVLAAGRAWYELWVPQDPNIWPVAKLIFRDIAEKPTFWIDRDGSVVNGDCYWLTCATASSEAERDDMLWLAAAVGNSTFIERFYDYRFNNKLYAGRRRYATQYVEQFPVPDPNGPIGQAIVKRARRIETYVGNAGTSEAEQELDSMIWEAFGVCP